ncbi:hypothetical protein K9L63_03460 [Candidatus Gracilibacteria bacterium]|nr:hypothetical protein [Candidatus Gracilibacteria bacterium]
MGLESEEDHDLSIFDTRPSYSELPNFQQEYIGVPDVLLRRNEYRTPSVVWGGSAFCAGERDLHLNPNQLSVKKNPLQLRIIFQEILEILNDLQEEFDRIKFSSRGEIPVITFEADPQIPEKIHITIAAPQAESMDLSSLLGESIENVSFSFQNTEIKISDTQRVREETTQAIEQALATAI